MARRTILPLVTVIAALSMSPTAHAHWWDGVGRHLGVGWGDGYHAKNACPPRHPNRNGMYGPVEVPWWAAPPAPAESLPHPAPGHPGPHIQAGPSLFRQPGEGSSVIVTEP